MNRNIIEDYKVGIFNTGFSVFHCKEFDKYIVQRNSIEAEERVKVLDHMEANGTPPEGYLVSVKNNGATIKRYFSRKKKKDVKQEIDVIKVADIPIKRNTKKEFKDEVLFNMKYYLFYFYNLNVLYSNNKKVIYYFC
jgi:hypothetical protein